MPITNPITAAVKARINSELPRSAAAGAGLGVGDLLSDLYEKLIAFENRVTAVEGCAWDEVSTSGLDFAYKDGFVNMGDGSLEPVSADTITLADDDVNYIEWDPSDTTMKTNVISFTAGRLPLFEVTTADGAIPATGVTDKRTPFVMLGDASVAAANLEDEVADVLNAVSISVGTESMDTIDVTIQVEDAQGNNLLAQRVLELWLSDSATGWITSTAADSLAVNTGTAMDVLDANKRLRCLTDTNGEAVIRIGKTGAQTWYMGVRLQDKLTFSTAIAFLA